MESIQNYDNQSGLNNQWTNRKQLDELNYIYEQLEISFRKIFQSLDKSGSNKKKNNIGLYCGNAIRQVYRYFKNKNVNFSHSKVRFCIEHYFDGLCKEATNYLESYVNKVFNSINDENDLRIYNNISDRVAFFDLEKDIETAVNYSLDWLMSLEHYSGGINKEIDQVNLELKELGIDKRISYRDDTINQEKKIVLDDKLKERIKKELDDYLKSLPEEERNAFIEKTNKYDIYNFINKDDNDRRL